MAGKFAAGTDVSVEKTRAEIESTVRRYGASGFVSGWEDDRAVVQFKAANRRVKFILNLPSQAEAAGVMVKSTAAKNAWEQECRQLWRALLLLVKAKLEAVESGIVTFEEEFLAHVVMEDGATVYERVRQNVALSYETGRHVLLIEGPRV